MFGRRWEPASATIVATHVKSSSGSGQTVAREFAADVVTDAGASFRALLQEPFIATDFWAPGIGDVVRVHADVERGAAKFDKSDPKISFKAYKAGADDRFEATLAEPGTPTASAAAAPVAPVAFTVVSPSPTQADPAERLTKLKALHDQGIVSDAEYEAKRQEILGTL